MKESTIGAVVYGAVLVAGIIIKLFAAIAGVYLITQPIANALEGCGLDAEISAKIAVVIGFVIAAVIYMTVTVNKGEKAATAFAVLCIAGGAFAYMAFLLATTYGVIELVFMMNIANSWLRAAVLVVALALEFGIHFSILVAVGEAKS